MPGATFNIYFGTAPSIAQTAVKIAERTQRDAFSCYYSSALPLIALRNTDSTPASRLPVHFRLYELNCVSLKIVSLRLGAQ